jgi:hypothetical protein
MDEDSAAIQDNGSLLLPSTLLAVGEKRSVKGAAKDPYIQKR